MGLIEVKNLSSAIADRLADLIQSGELRPGQHLVQTELAAQFAVSRVAVRDALNELRQMGLAVNIPRKGTVVRPVSRKAVHDVFAIRQVVEPLAVAEACQRLSSDDLAHLDRLIREQEELSLQPDPSQLVAKDWEFHQAIYLRCDNAPLEEIIAVLWSRIRQARNLARANLTWGQKWGEHSARRHRQVLEALQARNAAQAAQLVADNIVQAEQELLLGLEEAGWGKEELAVADDHT